MPAKKTDIVPAADTASKEAVGALEEVLGHLKKAGAGAGAKAETALEEAGLAVRRAADFLRTEAKPKTKALLDKAVAEAKAHPKTTAAIAAAAVALAGVAVAAEVKRRKGKKK